MYADIGIFLGMAQLSLLVIISTTPLSLIQGVSLVCEKVWSGQNPTCLTTNAHIHKTLDFGLTTIDYCVSIQGVKNWYMIYIDKTPGQNFT